MGNAPVLNEIALSCIDLVPAERWFREGLGFRPAGGCRKMAGAPIAGGILNESGTEAICWWMADAAGSCRIALHQFSLPYPHLKPAAPSMSDLGYVAIGLFVAHFDTTLAKLEALGSPPIGAILGERGQRRACVLSPDGLFVELVEHDPSAGVPTAVRSVTLSVADLDQARKRFEALLGVKADAPAIHDAQDEGLWRLAGAQSRRACFACGDVLLELVEYQEPRPTAPAPDYRFSDQGFFEIGFAVASPKDLSTRADGKGWRQASGRARGTRENLHLLDDEGVSVGISCRSGDKRPAFHPRGLNRYPSPERHRVHASAIIAAPLPLVWAALNDHDRMGSWIEADEFFVLRHGLPYSAGAGAERRLLTMGRDVGQQVTRVYPTHVGYRATRSPFAYHNGTVDIATCDGGTRIDWRIRFRTARDRRIGDAIQPQLQAGIEHMLGQFKAMVETEIAARD